MGSDALSWLETKSTADDPSTVPAGGKRNTLEPRYGGGTSVASIPRSPTAPVSQKSSPRLYAACAAGNEMVLP